jgi:hypothetical protein
VRFQFALEDKMIDYDLNMFSGEIDIFVNGYILCKDYLAFGGRKTTFFHVNNRSLCIAINQPTFFALFRDKTFEVYVDNVLYKVFDKKGNLIKDYWLSM